MAEKLCALKKRGRMGREFSLLGQQSIESTSTITVNLSESIESYEYLIFSFYPYDGDKISTTSPTSPILIFTKKDYFKQNQLTGYFTYGSPQNSATSILTYVSNNSLTVKNSTATARILYVYGL